MPRSSRTVTINTLKPKPKGQAPGPIALLRISNYAPIRFWLRMALSSVDLQFIHINLSQKLLFQQTQNLSLFNKKIVLFFLQTNILLYCVVFNKKDFNDIFHLYFDIFSQDETCRWKLCLKTCNIWRKVSNPKY